MSPESRELFERMNRMIVDATTLLDATIVERYLSLANRRLHKDKEGVWGIIGASLALREKYEAKFGIFVPSAEGILL